MDKTIMLVAAQLTAVELGLISPKPHSTEDARQKIRAAYIHHLTDLKAQQAKKQDEQ